MRDVYVLFTTIKNHHLQNYQQKVVWILSEAFFKKGVHINFAKLTGRHLCRSLFFKFIKKETLAQVFLVNFAKFLFLQNTFKYITFIGGYFWNDPNVFKNKIKKRKLENFLCRYCKVYSDNIGFAKKRKRILE